MNVFYNNTEQYIIFYQIYTYSHLYLHLFTFFVPNNVFSR